MEKKMVKVPFDLELAKKITNGEIEGRIIRNDGANVRIVCWNYKSLSGEYPLLALVTNGIFEESEFYTSEGRYKSWETGSTENEYNLSIELNEKEKYQFKPFDKVLVRDDDGVWFAGIFSHLRKDGEFLCVGAGLWEQCIPYNEHTAHLLGTTDNWEEKI